MSLSHRLVMAVGLVACVLLVVVLYVDPFAGGWGNVASRSLVASVISTAAVPLGGPLPSLAAMVLLLWAARKWDWSRGRQFVLLVPLVFVGAGLASHVIKIAVGRQRPFVCYEGLSGHTSWWTRRLDGRFHSFPSADVTVAAGLSMALFLLLEHGTARYLLFLLPAFSAAGRVLNARHYPSDCLAGAVLGMVVAWWLWRLHERRSAARLGHTAELGRSP